MTNGSVTIDINKKENNHFYQLKNRIHNATILYGHLYVTLIHKCIKFEVSMTDGVVGIDIN